MWWSTHPQQWHHITEVVVIGWGLLVTTHPPWSNFNLVSRGKNSPVWLHSNLSFNTLDSALRVQKQCLPLEDLRERETNHFYQLGVAEIFLIIRHSPESSYYWPNWPSIKWRIRSHLYSSDQWLACLVLRRAVKVFFSSPVTITGPRLIKMTITMLSMVLSADPDTSGVITI